MAKAFYENDKGDRIEFGQGAVIRIGLRSNYSAEQQALREQFDATLWRKEEDVD